METLKLYRRFLITLSNGKEVRLVRTKDENSLTLKEFLERVWPPMDEQGKEAVAFVNGILIPWHAVASIEGID